jgi:hypothetical protein
MVQLLRALDFERYTPRTYILSWGDHLSASKFNELELSKSAVSSCCQPMHTPLTTVAGGPTSGYEDDNSPTCSRNPPAALYHSIQHFKVSRARSDRTFAQAGAPRRTAGGFIASERTRDVRGDSRSCLYQSGTFIFLCIARVAGAGRN